MTAKSRQQSLSLLHDANVQLATFRNVVQQIGTPTDTIQLRKEVENCVKTCVRACENTKNCVLPQLRHEGLEFTRTASQFIACISACVVEMKRCAALENTFRLDDCGSHAAPQIAPIEEILETLENLITVHYSTSESAPDTKVTPRRRRNGTCRLQCMCSKLKTSYA